MLTTSRAGRRRTGITVVEVLIAIVLLSVGVLAVAGTSALSLRDATAARREREAIVRAGNRAALLSVLPCDQASSGTADEGDVHERWLVSPISPGAATLDVRVDWNARGGPRVFALASAVLC
jgi:Tfp pilus assembly protein PilV